MENLVAHPSTSPSPPCSVVFHPRGAYSCRLISFRSKHEPNDLRLEYERDVTRPRCEIEGATIVLVGSFNPRIFHPTWFAANNLLRPEEATAATSPGPEEQGLIVSPDLTVFKAGWLDLQVTQDRFLALASDPSNYNVLRDLVIGIFRLLEHTPIHQMGLNRHFHYSMPSVDEWNELGHFLVPKTPWTSVVDRPGMMAVTIQGTKPGEPNVRYNVRVEPSRRVMPGVFVDTNEHHQPPGDLGSKQLMKILEDGWQSAQDHGKKVADQLLESFYANRDARR